MGLARRVGDRDRDLVGGCSDGGREERDHRVEPWVVEQHRQRPRIALGGRRAEHVDRVLDASFGGEELAEAVRRGVREVRQLEPRRLARVRAEDPQTAGVREQADAPSARLRLRGEDGGDVDEFSQRGRPNDPRLPEGARRHRGLRAGERGCVRARGALARGRRAALQREHRLLARDLLGEVAGSAGG